MDKANSKKLHCNNNIAFALHKKRAMSECWIYHERQEAALCGQHALNNLVQAAIFSPGTLSEIAHQLDQMELTYMSQNNEGGIRSKDYLQAAAEESGNVDAQGNFSIEVLRAALMNQYSLSLPNIRQDDVKNSMDVTKIEGFICNRDSHWFAIRLINGRFWNLNSTKERPEQISHFRLAAEIETLQNEGYSVFCVTVGLPSPCATSSGRDRELPQFWWKEDDLVQNKCNAITAATDPWAKVGSGMRLDGKPKQEELRSEEQYNLGALTEDELMQMAVAASLEQAIAQNDQQQNNAASSPEKQVPVPPEPATEEAGACKIQFRMPDGKKQIRRFLASQQVAVVYAFVEEFSPGQGALVLKGGFPPKDLASQKEGTIAEAKLAGEMIQARYI